MAWCAWYTTGIVEAPGTATGAVGYPTSDIVVDIVAHLVWLDWAFEQNFDHGVGAFCCKTIDAFTDELLKLNSSA